MDPVLGRVLVEGQQLVHAVSDLRGGLLSRQGASWGWARRAGPADPRPRTSKVPPVACHTLPGLSGRRTVGGDRADIQHDRLDAAAAGIGLDAHGHIRTDGTYATSVPGIWALGDLANHFQLKHMANAEARLVQYNLLHPGQPRHAQFSVVRSVVFGDPQVASVGATEQDLLA